MAYLLQMFLIISHRPCLYGVTMYPLDLFDGSVLLLLLSLFYWKFLWSFLSKANTRYLHLVRTSIRCCSSVLWQFWCGKHYLGPMHKCFNYTVLCYYMMVTITMQVLISCEWASYIHLSTGICFCSGVTTVSRSGMEWSGMCPQQWIWLFGLYC